MDMERTNKNIPFEDIVFDTNDADSSKTGFIYRILNETMKPTLWAGDFLRLKITNKVIDGNVYAIKTTFDDEFIIRRLYKTDGGYILKSPNQRYTEFTLENGDITNIFEVCAVLRLF